MKKSHQSGFEAVGVLVVIVVLAVIGFAGYAVWKRSHHTTDSTASSSSGVPATIKSKADLDKATSALNASAADVNSSLDDSSLNSDINSLL